MPHIDWDQIVRLIGYLTLAGVAFVITCIILDAINGAPPSED